MALLNRAERRLAEGARVLTLSNPFLPERIEAEKAILGAHHHAIDPVWSIRADVAEETPNVLEIRRRTGALAEAVRDRVRAGAAATDGELDLSADLAQYVLYDRHHARFRDGALADLDGDTRFPWKDLYEEFRQDAADLLHRPGHDRPRHLRTEHLFALCFQIRRAFHHIFSCLAGASMAGARLRASVWQSIFTHDLRRFQRSLYRRMGDSNTLITGPSGTGKELVAQAIGLSRYVPYDPVEGRFETEIATRFHAVNLAALSPTLIESELFGHRKGAFTGALMGRAGWFEECGPHGSVFLDETSEVEPAIQVKLLRVLQSRSFVRLGETKPRTFEGKVIAATNRDPAEEMRAGRFREDLYYRLCADVIETPTLREQLRETPGDRRRLIRFLAVRLVGEEEADELADEAERWIEEALPADYAWPGNVRELEQCVRNVLIRHEYRPTPGPADAKDELDRVLADLDITAEELVSRYARAVHARTGTYEGAARVLGLDRRTVKRKIGGQ